MIFFLCFALLLRRSAGISRDRRGNSPVPSMGKAQLKARLGTGSGRTPRVARRENGARSPILTPNSLQELASFIDRHANILQDDGHHTHHRNSPLRVGQIGGSVCVQCLRNTTQHQQRSFTVASCRTLLMAQQQDSRESAPHTVVLIKIQVSTTHTTRRRCKQVFAKQAPKRRAKKMLFLSRNNAMQCEQIGDAAQSKYFALF